MTEYKSHEPEEVVEFDIWRHRGILTISDTIREASYYGLHGARLVEHYLEIHNSVAASPPKFADSDKSTGFPLFWYEFPYQRNQYRWKLYFSVVNKHAGVFVFDKFRVGDEKSERKLEQQAARRSILWAGKCSKDRGLPQLQPIDAYLESCPEITPYLQNLFRSSCRKK